MIRRCFVDAHPHLQEGIWDSPSFPVSDFGLSTSERTGMAEDSIAVGKQNKDGHPEMELCRQVID